LAANGGQSLITKPQVVVYRKLYGGTEPKGEVREQGLLSIFDCKLTWPPKG